MDMLKIKQENGPW